MTLMSAIGVIASLVAASFMTGRLVRVLDCRLGAHIAPEGFIAWNDRTDTGLATFAEADSAGPGAAERPAWVRALSGPEAAALLARARALCRPA